MAKSPTSSQTHTKKHLARLQKERTQRRYLIAGVGFIMLMIIGVIVYGILDEQIFKANRVVAQVGDQKISVKDFQAEVHFARFLLVRQYEQYAGNPILSQFYGQQIQQLQTDLSDPQTVGKRTIDQMISDLVVEQEAQKRGITVSDEELTNGLQEAFGFYANGTPTTAPTGTPFVTATYSATQLTWEPVTLTPTSTSTPDPATPTVTPVPPTATATVTPTGPTPTATMTDTPFPTSTPYTIEGYQTTFDDFAAQAAAVGYDEAHLKAYIRRGLLRDKVFEAITADTPKQDEKVWARHILVATEDEANQVETRLKNGEDFAKVAAEVSTDPGSKDLGGDLGWFGHGVMDATFEAATYALQIGEISQPINTSFGYHIIQLLGREVQPLTDSELQTNKQNAYNDWLIQAKDDLKATTNDLWMSVVPSDPVLTPIVNASGQ